MHHRATARRRKLTQFHKTQPFAIGHSDESSVDGKGPRAFFGHSDFANRFTVGNGEPRRTKESTP